SSMGIKAAILAAEGDIIAPSHAHQAIKEGCELANVKWCKFDTGKTEYGIFNVPSADDIKAAIKKYPNAKAIYLESPDYYGRVLDPEIIDLIKESGKYFFCDAAHGAHFAAHEKLFPQCYAAKADACNLSQHKTLDALTQSATLCVNNDSLMDGIKKVLKNLGTTSPSYILLASIEKSIKRAKNRKEEYEKLCERITEFKKKYNSLQFLNNDDMTRLVLITPQNAHSAKVIVERLAKNYGIYAERYEGDCVVFIATPHHTKEDFKILGKALSKVLDE
ncbi:MAG: aminotransferase class I/II-fold pyridoxal phosphate-dependent enzyme, partial [Firmicutes bacterium]|nr:aminotransferase class I/II-fold pyridoxal phosphate-dependent enzyme [Bacillota bacterium]